MKSWKTHAAPLPSGPCPRSPGAKIELSNSKAGALSLVVSPVCSVKSPRSSSTILMSSLHSDQFHPISYGWGMFLKLLS